MNHKSGQVILILVIVTMISALGVGISLVSRSVTSERETVYTVQNDQAFSCAEAGIETFIDCINNHPYTTETCYMTGGNGALTTCGFSYTGSEIRSPVEFKVLEKDQTEVLILEDKVSSVTITWNQVAEQDLEVNLLDGGVGGYALTQAHYGSANCSGTSCSVTIPTNIYNLMQITPRINRAENMVIVLTASGADPVPVQAYNIKSTGTAGQSLRNITVNYMPPHPGRVFNDAVYVTRIAGN